MLPGRGVAAAFPQSGTAIGAAGPAREFQVIVVWLPFSIAAVSDVTAADDRQRRSG